MHVRFWRFSPLYESADGVGAGAPDVAVETVDAGDDDGGLADHEAEFGAGAPRQAREAESDADAESDAAARTRDDKVQFTKPRHRAKSQQAGAADVPRIQELTRKHREAEERATAAERRAEEAERRATERRQEPERGSEPTRPAATAVEKFPTFVDWIAQDANKDSDYDGYIDARTAHNYAALRATERERESAEAAQRTEKEQSDAYYAGFDAARKEYPDFDDVIGSLGPQDVSKVVERAVMAVGPKAAYYLASHRDDLLALTADTLRVAPENPAFSATVAATKRYLSTLVASPQRSTSTRAAAGTTGAARATTPTIAPKPPTLVRTGASRDAEDLPGDDASLADHEKAFGSKRRRA